MQTEPLYLDKEAEAEIARLKAEVRGFTPEEVDALRQELKSHHDRNLKEASFAERLDLVAKLDNISRQKAIFIRRQLIIHETCVFESLAKACKGTIFLHTYCHELTGLSIYGITKRR